MCCRQLCNAMTKYQNIAFIYTLTFYVDTLLFQTWKVCFSKHVVAALYSLGGTPLLFIYGSPVLTCVDLWTPPGHVKR